MTNAPLLANAKRMAKVILNGFDAFFAEFENITLGAQARFEAADWHAVQAAMQERLQLWHQKRAVVAENARVIAGQSLNDRALWSHTKQEFADLACDHSNYEIAQSFFNSIYCYVFDHDQILNEHCFLLEPEKLHVQDEDLVRRYTYEGDIPALIEQMLDDTGLHLPFEDKARDIAFISEVVDEILVPQVKGKGENLVVEVLDSLFFRNKAANLVGRVIADGKTIPFVFPIINNEKGAVYVDTVLHTEDDISIVFGFSRSYFMVYASVPSKYVAFLKELMPQKEIFELYMSIGMPKHGKSEFFRFAVANTVNSSDPYIIAPGIKGMVMLVFTRPDFDYVYKVIKDRFTPPKDMTRQHVKDCYKMVKLHSRAGRMADTQEFNNLAFDRRRFSDELMEELKKEAPSLIEEHGNTLVIKHVYIERKMIPLNLYLRDCTDEQLESVMDEYGNAIKQLAASNIFPGDMLLKNFGVTRHGRVVFYDYDEIVPLVDCNFRELPEPQNDEQAFATQPWYDIKPNDVFPEEFRLFFSGNRRAKAVFDKMHNDLYDPEFWRGLQEDIRNGYVADVLPYRRKQRFAERDV